MVRMARAAGMKFANAPDVLSTKQAGILLGLSTETVKKYCQLKIIPAKKPKGKWLIRKSDLLEWLDD